GSNSNEVTPDAVARSGRALDLNAPLGVVEQVAIGRCPAAHQVASGVVDVHVSALECVGAGTAIGVCAQEAPGDMVPAGTTDGNRMAEEIADDQAAYFGPAASDRQAIVGSDSVHFVAAQLDLQNGVVRPVGIGI